MTVAENVAITPRLLGWEAERVRARVDELLDLVRLDKDVFRDRLPHELSGGQGQRVGFARALAAEPSAMLLDEPFGALDPVTRDELQLEFKRIQQTLGFAALFVTHDMTEALLLADRIVVMQAGRVAQSGTPRELLQDPKPGYVAALMAAPRRQAERLGELAPGPEEPGRP